MMPDFHLHPVLELKRLLLLEPAWTVAAAESLTCGIIQARLGSVSGSSGYFVGGLTAYTLEQKVRLLGVDPERAAPVNSVSREVAEQMARGVADLFGTDFSVATTGYAEPDPVHGVAQPCAWWAVCRRREPEAVVRSGFVEVSRAERQAAQRAVADHALAELLRLVAGERSR